ncbi:hypothetical protein GCM10010358_78340 [Streptomyces minutiscleroticus]|uniref:Uncharacterized protein n=1 Tax=Streptomyces minutiscleroticus TaxID=68238 RepID=A0A918U9R7_9ACTN|nr:hypothetical protein GCM10010358_78340 [Streptomyces minutiscleroticus]
MRRREPLCALKCRGDSPIRRLHAGAIFGLIGSGGSGAHTLRANAAQRTVREADSASRTDPPPAGMEAAASPSPLDPVQRADPRTVHGSAPPVAGEERTGGRTATQREHAATHRTCTTGHNPAIRNYAS